MQYTISPDTEWLLYTHLFCTNVKRDGKPYRNFYGDTIDESRMKAVKYTMLEAIEESHEKYLQHHSSLI